MTPLRLSAVLLCAILAFQATSVSGWQMQQGPLMTQWAAQVDTNNPLPEYPRPQMVRSNWMNLNGIWQFQPGTTNTDPVPTNQTLSSQILVPYPMESAISGVMQYHAWSWYRRIFSVPASWSGQHVILHFDAVDWQAQVFINGQSLGTHRGGYDALSYDITGLLTTNGTQELIVQVYNPVDNGSQPRGKQTLYPGGIMYTSASGPWQPVWLEPVDVAGAQNLVIVPDVDNSRLRLTVNAYNNASIQVYAEALAGTNVVSTGSGVTGAELDLPIANPKLWSPDNPFLYSLQITLVNAGVTNDFVTSYFGMRKISTNFVNGVPRIFLNNQIIYGMGPLDQGFWPDGIYTAPTDNALKYDLQEEKALGFNSVRKHIKVERQRWYYWADTLGLMVWQDMPSCNSYTGNPSPPAINATQFEAELSAMVTNHWNSPCIIMWDVFNEAQGEAGSGNGVGQASTASLVQLVENLDPYRLVNQASGGSYFGVGNVLDNHSYPAPGNPVSTNLAPVCGEFGGIGLVVPGHLWNPAQAGGSYIPSDNASGIAPIYDQFVDEIVGFKAGGLNASIYTQITDVENECNGLMTYDRVLKPDPTRIMLSNQKAITGQAVSTVVLPTSQSQNRTWKYSTNTNIVSTNWYATSFNDSSWSSGLAPFGQGDPGVVTAWNTANIWIRQWFPVGSLTPSQISNLAFDIFYDEGCEIYINGVLAATTTGYVTTYVEVPMNAAGQGALLLNSSNLIAIHCVQTTGGQEIDAGISSVITSANTYVPPVDYAAWWRLDETNGTIAYDYSGNGDNAIVSGAAWNPQGKINGCLSFNGTNSYAQVNRDVTNDFSVAFWLQTMQVGGTGNWRQGSALVDGSAGPGANDFGTALVGNQLAFGMGNPDTTLLSTTPVNDGAWHFCVATRVQSTGVMQLYVDGSLQAQGSGNTNSVNATAYLRFGASLSSGGFFSGNLDEIKIYDRALGNLEIAALYADGNVPPAPPANLTANAGNAQVSLNWWESPVASFYNVGRSLTSGGLFTLIGSTSSASFTDSNVINGVKYYYVVSAMDSAGQSVLSTEVSAEPVNVVAWFKADSIAGLTNGAAIADWADSSGQGNDAIQTNSLRRPMYLTNAMNGLPVVHFNSAGSNYLSFNRPVQDDFTIACVFRSSQGLNSGPYYYSGAGLVSGEVSGVINDFGTCLFANGEVAAGTGNPDVSVDSTSGYNDGRPHLLVFKRVESSGLVSLYVDGTLGGTTTGGTQSLTSPSVLVLGAQKTLLYFLTGDIAEVKIYNSALSDNDRVALQNSLAAKWGISGLAAPAVLTAAPGNGSVTLNWSVAANASGYLLQRATNIGGPFTIVATPSASPFTDTHVTNGTTYYYQIAASNTLAQSAYSYVVSATPSATTAMVAWFRADALGLGNGASVALWPDLSGNGNNAAQTNSGSQPTYVTSAMNGLPVVRFTSSRSTSLSLPRPVQNDFTIVCVFQSTQGLNSGTNFFQGAGLVDAEVAGTANDFGTSLNSSGRILAGTGNPDITVESSTGYNEGNPHVFTFTRVRSSGALTLYVDGSQVATGSAGTQSLTAPTNVVIGAQRTSLYYLSGDIAEVQIYGSALPSFTRQSLETSLRVKYMRLAPPSFAAPMFSNKSLTLAWPAVPGYTLYTATNLTPPLFWYPASNVIFSNNGTDTVTLLPTNGSQFFELLNQ
jgi:hypothetical protein